MEPPNDSVLPPEWRATEFGVDDFPPYLPDPGSWETTELVPPTAAGSKWRSAGASRTGTYFAITLLIAVSGGHGSEAGLWGDRISRHLELSTRYLSRISTTLIAVRCYGDFSGVGDLRRGSSLRPKARDGWYL